MGPAVWEVLLRCLLWIMFRGPCSPALALPSGVLVYLVVCVFGPTRLTPPSIGNSLAMNCAVSVYMYTLSVLWTMNKPYRQNKVVHLIISPKKFEEHDRGHLEMSRSQQWGFFFTSPRPAVQTFSFFFRTQQNKQIHFVFMCVCVCVYIFIYIVSHI